MSNTKQVSLQDPVLTKLAQGYYNNELVCETLMPIVEIEKETGVVPKFGRLSFRQHSTIRQLHGKSNRLTPEYVTTVNVALEEHDIEYPIDYREDNDASYPLKQYALSVTQDIIALGREIEVAELAQNADNYDESNKKTLTTEETKLTNLDVNPLILIDEGINAISKSIGYKPNVCVIAGDVWAKLKENKVLLERIKYTRTGILTPDIFAELIGIETVKIGEATQEVSNELKAIWTNCIVLAYVSPRSKDKKGNIYDPSFGYTIRRSQGLKVDTYHEIGGKIEIVRCTDIYKPHLLGSSAGYLINGCIK